ncbi:MAG: cell division protein FtsA [Rickettsiaceae bacterium]|nr:cell division protein FtsA [Rickettsiaceae bacterium]
MKKKSSNFVVFDIGSSKIAALAAHNGKQGDTKINAQILQYSEGFKSGSITHMEMAENSIVNAIYALEQDYDKSINEITISLSGAGVKSYYINHSIKLGNQPISKQDIKKLITKAIADFQVKDQEIIHYFPMEFVIDSNQVVENPIGMYAREMSCQLHIISADHLMLKNLTSCVAKCHVEISDIVVSIYASGVSCLSDDEKELGAIIVDIGSHTTSFGMFLDNKIIYTGHVPIGSSHITTDIAKAFSISRVSADKLKILYGTADPDLLTKDSIIRLNTLDPNNSHDSDLTISTKHLAEIICPRMREIFSQIKKQCDHVAMDHLLANSLVLTGGGAALSGITSLAAEVFQKQVRIAKPATIPGFVDNYNPYIYSTALGIVKLKSLKSEHEEEGGWFKKTFTWLKENI